MASEPEGVPPQPVRPDDVKSSGGQSALQSKDAPAQPVAGTVLSPPGPASAAALGGSTTGGSAVSTPAEAGTPSAPPGAVPQSDNAAPTPVPQNPEGFPSAELDRTSPVSDVGGAVPADHTGASPHDPDPYHQEPQHDYGSEYHHDDPYHNADHHSGGHHDEYSQHHSGDSADGGYQYPVNPVPPPEEEHGFV